MVRSLLIFVGSFAVVAAGFFFVWKAQRATIVTAAAPAVQLPIAVVNPSSNISQGGIGPASRATLKSFEKGRLVSEFTAAEMTPQKDGSFAVKSPVYRFFMTNGQVVQVKGDSGVVYTDNGGPQTSGSPFGASSQTPRNGTLKKVHIEIFPSASATRSTTQMDTDNIKFDNDTLRIFTDPIIDSGGAMVAGDKVPVTVRGDDYEMDGQGLTVRWNGIDGHLQLLEISHGQRLLIKNPSKMSLPGMPATQPARETERSQAKKLTMSLPWPDALASSDPAAISLAKPAPATAVKPPIPYRAVFSDDVKVKQGDRRVALADSMTIDFLQGSDAESGPAPTGNAKGDSTTSAMTPAVARTPETIAAVSSTAINAPATMPATKPTTRPTNERIEILWSGPLVVKPLDTTLPMMPLLPKQSVVRLVGSPAILTPEGAEVRAVSATYRTPDGAVELESSPAIPLIYLKQIKGKVNLVELKAGSLRYDPQTCLATILSPPPKLGPSLLTMPIANQPKPMTISWSQKAVIHTVVPTGQTQPGGADQIDLSGAVAVAHPAFLLDSDELHVHLATVPKPHGKKGDTTEEPKLITAVGEVYCEMLSTEKPGQGLKSDRLSIAMEQSAQDKSYPRRVLAEGNVYAFDPDQYLRADQLEIMLRPKLTPATQPAATQRATTDPSADMAGAAQLESIHATSNVRAVMKDKSTADCDDLRLNTYDGGKELVELSGDRGAMLTNGNGSWLHGSVLHLAPASNVITVDGPGLMHTIQNAASPTTGPTTVPSVKPTTRPSTPRPIDISWSDSMSVSGLANTADIVGHVIVHTVDTGGVSTVTGDRAHIDFIDAPKPTTQKSTTRKSPAAGETADIGMGSKQLKRLTLIDNMHAESVLKDADGKLLRHTQLFGQQLVYTANDRKAVIPGAGKLMVENHKSDAKSAAGDSGNGQGRMNIVWTRQLTFDQNTNVVTIDGNTHTRFQPDDSSAKSAEKNQVMDLDAQELVVTLKNEKPGVGSKVKPVEPAAENGKTRLSHLLAVGSVHFAAKAIDFDAHSVDYGTAAELAAISPHFARELRGLHCSPDAQVMIARGTDQEPGETHDADGRASGSFGELIYDVQRQEVLSVSDVHAAMRR